MSTTSPRRRRRPRRLTKSLPSQKLMRARLDGRRHLHRLVEQLLIKAHLFSFTFFCRSATLLTQLPAPQTVARLVCHKPLEGNAKSIETCRSSSRNRAAHVADVSVSPADRPSGQPGGHPYRHLHGHPDPLPCHVRACSCCSLKVRDCPSCDGVFRASSST